MNDDAMTRLEQRIARLELSNRRWRGLAAGSMIGLACLGLMGAQRGNVTKFDQIEARRIVVRDPAGHEVVTLGMIEKYPGLRVKSPSSGANATLFTTGDHMTFALSDNNGSSSITINGGGPRNAPDLSMIRVGDGSRVQRLFRAP